MRVHVNILSLSILFSIIYLVSIYILITYYDCEKYQIVLSFVYLIFVMCYPAGFYTYWRTIALGNKEGKTLYGIIRMSHGKIPGTSVFIVPLLISPLLFVRYISFLKEDFKKYKNKEDIYE